MTPERNQRPWCPKCHCELDGPMPPAGRLCRCAYCKVELVVTEARTYALRGCKP